MLGINQKSLGCEIFCKDKYTKHRENNNGNTANSKNSLMNQEVRDTFVRLLRLSEKKIGGFANKKDTILCKAYPEKQRRFCAVLDEKFVLSLV